MDLPPPRTMAPGCPQQAHSVSRPATPGGASTSMRPPDRGVPQPAYGRADRAGVVTETVHRIGDCLPIDRSPFEATVPIWSISSEDGAFFERHSKFFTQRGHGEVDAAIAIPLGTHHIWDELIRQRSLARGTSYFAWDTGTACCACSRPYTSSRKCTVPSLLAQPSR